VNVTPATIASTPRIADIERTARVAALRAAIPGIIEARQRCAPGPVARWRATTRQVAALIAEPTRHEGIWPDQPTLVPVARQSLAEVRIPGSCGRPVRVTTDPDLPESGYDWYDLDRAFTGATVVRVSSDGYRTTARRLPRHWDTTRDRWILGDWEVTEDLRED
jgi:hypothetical protein